MSVVTRVKCDKCGVEARDFAPEGWITLSCRGDRHCLAEADVRVGKETSPRIAAAGVGPRHWCSARCLVLALGLAWPEKQKGAAE